MISFISENDDLLYGIEIFTIAHEYAHLMFKVYDYDQFHFKEYFDTEFDKLIKSNEEIAADAVPLLILYNYTCKTVNKQLTLYSPEFLFKNLSNSEASELLCKPRSHPSHIELSVYKKMITKLVANDTFNQMDTDVDHTWEICKKKILRSCKRIKLMEIYLIMKEDLKRRDTIDR